MQIAWAAKRTCRLSRSASEYTATVARPNSLQAQITRSAISPRLATSTFLKGSDAKQSLPVLDRLSVSHQLAGHHAGDFRFDLVHQLHRFDDAEHRPRLHGLSDAHKGRAAGRRAFVERAHNRRLDQHLILGRSRRRTGGGHGGRRGRGSRRWSGNGGLDLQGGEAYMPLALGPPDAHAVLSSLHLELGDTALIYHVDQFTNLFNSHLRTSCRLPVAGRKTGSNRQPTTAFHSSRTSLDVGVRISQPL